MYVYRATDIHPHIHHSESISVVLHVNGGLTGEFEITATRVVFPVCTRSLSGEYSA